MRPHETSYHYISVESTNDRLFRDIFSCCFLKLSFILFKMSPLIAVAQTKQYKPVTVSLPLAYTRILRVSVCIDRCVQRRGQETLTDNLAESNRAGCIYTVRSRAGNVCYSRPASQPSISHASTPIKHLLGRQKRRSFVGAPYFIFKSGGRKPRDDSSKSI